MKPRGVGSFHLWFWSSYILSNVWGRRMLHWASDTMRSVPSPLPFWVLHLVFRNPCDLQILWVQECWGRGKHDDTKESKLSTSSSIMTMSHSARTVSVFTILLLDERMNEVYLLSSGKQVICLSVCLCFPFCLFVQTITWKIINGITSNKSRSVLKWKQIRSVANNNFRTIWTFHLKIHSVVG